MAYTWSKNLDTGNMMIDTQHKQLIQAINDLLEACSKGKGRDELKKTVDFLLQYTLKHFGDEEKLQQSTGYPDYPNHRKLHAEFTQAVRDLSKELEEKGSSIVMVGKINSAVGDWLIRHIQKEDVKVAKHVQDYKK
ncbi:MAG: bacteriohemerythrin [Oscillospiraceae bacterium]|nr:bacteriohemerythrin [Oscillospiraceae bacterium]